MRFHVTDETPKYVPFCLCIFGTKKYKMANQDVTVMFEGNHPGTFRLVYNDALQGPEFQESTSYGVRITRRVELTFEAQPGYPGNESLQLYRECDFTDDEDDSELNYYKFCELALRRMHHRLNKTVPLTVEMLESLTEKLREYYDESFDFQTQNHGDNGDPEEFGGMITHANDIAISVLQQFQQEYDRQQGYGNRGWDE